MWICKFMRSRTSQALNSFQTLRACKSSVLKGHGLKNYCEIEMELSPWTYGARCLTRKRGVVSTNVSASKDLVDWYFSSADRTDWTKHCSAAPIFAGASGRLRCRINWRALCCWSRFIGGYGLCGG